MKNSLMVCVVVPAYNEASVIADVINSSKRMFKKSKYKIDIVVINDGSRDETSETAITAGAVVIDHVLNSGAGGATATGLRYAELKGYDIAATMDADGQHNPRDVLAGIDYLIENDVDLLIGSRLIDSTGMSRSKVLGNKGLSFITSFLFGVRSTDSQSGLRIFSKKALNQLRWKTSGYEFCSEMLWRARSIRLKIDEYPIEAIYTQYSKNKGQNNWNAVNIVKSLIKRRLLEIFE